MIDTVTDQAEATADAAQAFLDRISELLESSQSHWETALARGQALPAKAKALIADLDEIKSRRSALEKRFNILNALQSDIDVAFEKISKDIEGAFTEVGSDCRTSIANGATSAAKEITEKIENLATGAEQNLRDLIDRIIVMSDTMQGTLREGEGILTGAERTISRVLGDATCSCQAVCALVGSTVEVTSSDVGRVAGILDDAINALGGAG